MENTFKHYAHIRPFSAGQSRLSYYSPTDLKTSYNFPPGLNGSGQKVAFIELGGGFVQADLNRFFNQRGISSVPTVHFVSVDGGTNSPTNANSDDIEVMLDLTVAIGVANGIIPYVYMAPNTINGFVDAINRAVTDRVNIISISWGAPEDQWSTPAINAMNAAFSAAIAAGISVFAAAGDSGSSDGERGNHVDFPASSPYVTGCGGTNLATNSSNVWINETVWHSNYGATGGGLSAKFTMPSYQNGTGIAGNKRGVPDVAGVADPASGILVPCDGANYVVGGTSAVAPLWAGITAVMNQGLNRHLGFLNPLIYPVFLHYTGAFNNAPLHDVTIGNNGAFSAKRGWDSCTGCGTPNVQLLMNALR